MTTASEEDAAPVVGAMRRAVALSGLGLVTTSPNPPVGCVILDSAGRIVGEGYHERKGEPHAETLALAAAGRRAAGGTAVVTLEPCNHHGRTPPCHQALIDAGVERVVISVLDPTSRKEGGAARLRAAGIAVEVGLLAEEALLVLGPWLMALHETRPRVTWAYQLGRHGLRAVPEDLATEARLRRSFDAVLREDGSVEEGASGTHGQQAFRLTPTDLNQGASAVVSSLYSGGTRSLLLQGGLPLAKGFLDVGLIDEIWVFFTSAASIDPGSAVPTNWPLLPPDFYMLSISKLHNGVVIRAEHRGPIRPPVDQRLIGDVDR